MRPASPRWAALFLVLGGCRHLGPARPVPEATDTSEVLFLSQVGHAPASGYTAGAFSVDGRLVLVGHAEGPVHLWQPATQQLVRVWTPHDNAVVAVAFSADGRSVLSAGRDGRVCRMALERHTPPQCRQGRVGDIHAAAFSPDGARLLTGSRNPGVGSRGTDLRVWDLATGRQRGAAPAHQREVAAVAWSDDGQWIASGGELDHTAMVHRAALDAANPVLDGHEHHITSIAWAGSDRVLTGSWDGTARLWDATTAAEIGRLPLTGFRGPSVLDTVFGNRTSEDVVAVAVLPDGRRAVTGDRGGTLALSDLETLEVLDRWWIDPGEGSDQLEIGLIVPDPVNDRVLVSLNRGYEDQEREAELILWDLEDPQGSTRLAIEGTPWSAVVALDDGRVRFGGAHDVWQFDPGTLTVEAIRSDVDPIAAFTGDGAFALSGQGTVWPLDPVADPQAIGSGIRAASEDGSRLVDAWGEVVLGSTGQTTGFGGLRSEARAVAISADGRWVARSAFAGGDDELYDVQILDVAAGRVHGTLKLRIPVAALAFSPDGRILATGESDTDFDPGFRFDYRIRLWEVATGRELHTLAADRDGVGALAFSDDGRWLLAGGANFRVSWLDRGTQGCDLALFDVDTGTRVRTLRGHTGRITGIAFLPGASHAVSISRDRTARLWRLDSGDAVTLTVEGRDWLVHSDDGYFEASTYGHRLVAAVQGQRIFGIDQLAPRNNRPDLLLERMGLGDQRLRDHYAARYRRRLRRLGLRAEDLAASVRDAPSASIVGVQIDPEAGTATVGLHLEAGAADLLRYNVYANGVPLLTAEGRRIEGRSLATSEVVALIGGVNRIEVGVLDQAGLESLRASSDVEHAHPDRGDLYFVGFGVSRYRDRRLDLDYAHKDAMDLATLLSGATEQFGQIHLQTHLDEAATVASLQDAARFLQPATVHDTVVVFVAGHGMHTRDDEAVYHFLTHEADLGDIRGTAAPFEAVEGLLDGIAPRRKLLLLDTCESGERDDDEVAMLLADAAGRGVTARALDVLGETAAAPPPRPFLRSRDRFIYNDLQRRTGAVVFASSRGSEASYELARLQNGAFTQAMLDALTTDRDTEGRGWLTIEELEDEVASSVAEFTGDRQHPTIDRNNRQAPIALPIVPGAGP